MIHSKETIGEVLKDKPEAVSRALKVIHKTVGWNQSQANFAKSLVDQIDKWEKTPPEAREFKQPLSQRQTDAARSLLIPYLPVLARLANEKVMKEKGIKKVDQFSSIYSEIEW